MRHQMDCVRRSRIVEQSFFLLLWMNENTNDTEKNLGVVNHDPHDKLNENQNGASTVQPLQVHVRYSEMSTRLIVNPEEAKLSKSGESRTADLPEIPKSSSIRNIDTCYLGFWACNVEIRECVQVAGREKGREKGFENTSVPIRNIGGVDGGATTQHKKYRMLVKGLILTKAFSAEGLTF